MGPTVHAIALLAIPVLTLVWCRKFWKRPPSRRRAIWAVTASLVFALFPPHACDEGRPSLQLLFGGICVAFLLTCATNRRVALALGIGMGLATIGLALHYDDLVHGAEYTGRLREGMGSRYRRSKSLERVRSDVAAAGTTAYPAGWLSDYPKLTDPQVVRGSGEQAEFLWHSRFTWLYRRRTVPMEIWYPGGLPAEAAATLEWRDR